MRVNILAVMFEIEIVNFVDLKVADDFGHYTKEEREKISLDQLVSVANAIREVTMMRSLTCMQRAH